VSEQVETWNAMADHRKALRAKFGVNCPQCAVKRPKAHPTILLPQQRCRVDGYRDPRPELTNEEWASA
jgi:hypothetical protein